jgi:pentapeptide MXKDX repeat protein
MGDETNGGLRPLQTKIWRTPMAVKTINRTAAFAFFAAFMTFAGVASAADSMKDDSMKSDSMKGDAMKGDTKKGDAMKHDNMKGDSMKGDTMKNDK